MFSNCYRASRQFIKSSKNPLPKNYSTLIRKSIPSLNYKRKQCDPAVNQSTNNYIDSGIPHWERNTYPCYIAWPCQSYRPPGIPLPRSFPYVDSHWRSWSRLTSIQSRLHKFAHGWMILTSCRKRMEFFVMQIDIITLWMPLFS